MKHLTAIIDVVINFQRLNLFGAKQLSLNIKQRLLYCFFEVINDCFTGSPASPYTKPLFEGFNHLLGAETLFEEQIEHCVCLFNADRIDSHESLRAIKLVCDENYLQLLPGFDIYTIELT